MKRKIGLFIFFVLIIFYANSWGKKSGSSSSAPATSSSTTQQTQQQVQQAQQKASEAKQHAENAKQATSAKEAVAEAKKTEQAAKESYSANCIVAKNAAQAKAEALAGKEGAAAAFAEAEKARMDAEKAQIAAYKAKQEADSAVAEYNLSRDDWLDAEAQSILSAEEYEEFKRLLEETQQADEAFTEAYKRYKEKCEALTKAEEKLNTETNKKNSLKTTNKKIESLKKDLDNAAKEAEQYDDAALYYAEKMADAYNRLGEFRDKYGLAGDPVNIATGAFVADYVDYVAQDFLQPFTIERSFKIDIKGNPESFGPVWTSPLDSRIVRCKYNSYNDIKNQLLEIDGIIDSMKALFDQYNIDYSKYPRTEECEEYYAEIKAKKKDNSIDLEEVNEIQANYEKLNELNRYVTYGRYSNPDSYFGYSNQIIYLDSNGREYKFIYDKNGYWRALGKLSVGQIKIYGLKTDGSFSDSDDTSGGYIVSYFDGRKKTFNKYGILLSEMDANGNLTVYENINGRINKITLKTGEIINITRDSNQLIKSINGNVSGSAVYEYDEKGMLTSVIDNDGIIIQYSYDNAHNLTKITKSDGKFVSINYSYNINDNKFYCSSVINENGDEEYFTFDFQNRIMNHKTYDEKSEVYKFDEFNNPVYIKDKFENVTTVLSNEDELVISYTQNNVKKDFRYDENYRPVQMILDNNVSVNYEYNNFGQISKVTDADGFIRSFEFDEKGNVIAEKFCDTLLCEYSYYPNGLLKERNDLVSRNEYKYNQYGSIIEKKSTLKSGNVTTVFAEYNQQNKIVKFTDEKGNITDFLYENGKITETTLHKKTEHFIDNRNREYKTIYTDLDNNIIHSTKKEFDGKGNVIKIFLDDILYREYTYSKDNILIEEKHWVIDDNIEKSCVIISNIYNSRGYLEKQNKIVGNRNLIMTNRNFTFNNDTMIIKNQNENGSFSTYEYDKYGKLIKECFADGYSIKTIYSHAGRIQSKVDSDNSVWNYLYNSDGSYEIILTTKSGIKSFWKYNIFNQLYYHKDFAGNEFFYEYDENGNIIKESNPLFKVCSKFDNYNRRIYTKTLDKNGKNYYEYKINFDDIKNSATIIRGNEICKSVKFDAFGNIIESIDENGCHLYTYDILGNCKTDTDSCGNVVSYLYDADNNICKKTNPNGSFESYNYNQYGNVESIFTNEKMYYSFVNNIEDKTIIVKDCFGSKNSFFYNQVGEITGYLSAKTGQNQFSNEKVVDEFGNVIQESLPGRKMNYSYDLNGRINAVYKNGKLVLQNEYFENNVITDYSDGTKTEVCKDIFGNVTKISNDNSVLEYEYDSYGQMISSYDSISNVKVEYFYDNYGRCIEKKADNFDLYFDYNNCGKLEKITERKSGTWILFEYDSLYREIKRTFWNGVTTRTNYDFQGLIESRVTENLFNQLVSANFIIRDENNRVSIVCNENGEFEKYSYDENGRMISSISPYTDEKAGFYLKEYIDCGLPYSNDNDVSTEKNLLDEEKSELKKIIEKSKVQTNVQINSYQKSWVDEYTYTDSGAISSIKNAFGNMIYEYDTQNRLQKKYTENFPDYCMNYYWNENGNLINVENKYKSIQLSYNSMNKLVEISEKNNQDYDEQKIQYSYDALGRRINEVDLNKSYVFVYDGISTTLIGKYVTQNDFTVNNFYLNSESGVGKGYRWVDNDNYVPNGSVKTFREERTWANDNTEQMKDERSFFLLSLNKVPLAFIYLDGNFVSGVDADNLVLDYKSNCVGVCDSNANCIAKNYYDIWGNCISNDKIPVFNYSLDYFSGNFNLFNLGSRDYAASMKSFISEDSARDGGNWYGYCCTDPVNYFDYGGKSIIPIIQNWLMTDKEFEEKTLGNSDKTKIKDCGCFLITFANILFTLKYNGYDLMNEDYTDPLEINNDKNLFKKEAPDEIKFGDLLDKTLGKNKYTVYEKLKNESKITEALLKKAMYSFDEYYISAVFDLTEVNPDFKTHMIGLNDIANDKGVFNEDDVTSSSIHDYDRLVSDKNYYRTDNINKLVLIKTKSGSDKCSK